MRGLREHRSGDRLPHSNWMESLFAPVLTGHSGKDESSVETGHNGRLQTFVCVRTKGVQRVWT